MISRSDLTDAAVMTGRARDQVLEPAIKGRAHLLSPNRHILTTVTPAQAGGHRSQDGARHPWIPSFDGMTTEVGRDTFATGN